MKNNERSYKKFEEEKTMEDYEINNNEAKESKKSVLGWILGGLGVLAAAAGAGAGVYAILRVRKNKKAKAETEALEGYDDDESLELEDLD